MMDYEKPDPTRYPNAQTRPDPKPEKSLPDHALVGNGTISQTWRIGEPSVQWQNQKLDTTFGYSFTQADEGIIRKTGVEPNPKCIRPEAFSSPLSYQRGGGGTKLCFFLTHQIHFLVSFQDVTINCLPFSKKAAFQKLEVHNADNVGKILKES